MKGLRYVRLCTPLYTKFFPPLLNNVNTAESLFSARVDISSSGGKNCVYSGVHSLMIVNSAQAHKINKAEVLELPQICLQYFSATYFDYSLE